MMTYEQTLDFLYRQLPMYQKEGKTAYKPGLERIKKLLAFLKNPEDSFKTVHVAGTNGKGTTCHLLAATLQKQGYKVGLYTSPHLVNFTERVKINGKEIPKQKVIEFTQLVLPKIDKLSPSFFELSVALAFWHFSKQNLDIAIIETGLGGRLDSTNVISPILSIITNISFDHQEILGDTLAKIATEKAGIIKKGTPVLIGRKQKEITQVFAQKSKETTSQLSYANDYPKNPYNLNSSSTLTENQQTVYAALQILKNLDFPTKKTAIQEGFLHYKSITGLKGRFDFTGSQPNILLDTAHNEEGVRKLIAQIKTLTYDNLHIVWGMVKDKDTSKILKLLPKTSSYYFCKPNVVRGLDAKLLDKKARVFKLKGKAFPSVQQAINAARANAKQKDLIFIGGSTFVVADAYSDSNNFSFSTK